MCHLEHEVSFTSNFQLLQVLGQVLFNPIYTRTVYKTQKNRSHNPEFPQKPNVLEKLITYK